MMKISEEARQTFLDDLRKFGNVSRAARLAKIPRREWYKTREADEAFAAAWDEAHEEAIDALEAEARRRGVEGVEEPVFYRGDQVGSIQKYSDGLLTLLLTANRAKFKTRQAVEHSGGVAVTVVTGVPTGNEDLV